MHSYNYARLRMIKPDVHCVLVPIEFTDYRTHYSLFINLKAAAQSYYNSILH